MNLPDLNSVLIEGTIQKIKGDRLYLKCTSSSGTRTHICLLPDSIKLLNLDCRYRVVGSLGSRGIIIIQRLLRQD